MNEYLFHILFGVLFLIFFIGQAINVSRAIRRGGQFEYREKHHVAMQLFRKGVGIPWLLAIISYVVKPQWVDWASFSLPPALRWVGLGLGVFSLLVIWWTELTLGENFNTTLHLRQEHTLVVSGPYRYVRHPMYTAHAIFALGLFVLASANWLILIPGVLGFGVLMVVRVRNEEEVMSERFGDAYRQYAQRTGRFLPRLGG